MLRVAGWLYSGLFFLFVAFAFAQWGWKAGLALAVAYVLIEVLLWRTILRPVADRINRWSE